MIIFRNERWYELHGAAARRERAPGRTIVHPDDAAATAEAWDEATPTGEPFEVEYRLRRADGTYRWHPRPLGLPARRRGERTGWVGTATDIEDRKLAEERQAFLAEAGWVLGSSLDYEQTLADVARLAVPRVADWCAVDIFVDGKLQRLALEHADPLKLALARELEEPMLVGGRRRDADDRARARDGDRRARSSHPSASTTTSSRSHARSRRSPT